MGFFSCNYLTTINFLHKSLSPSNPSQPRLENKKLRDGRKDIEVALDRSIEYSKLCLLCISFIAPPGAKRLFSLALETYPSLDIFCPFIVHLATCYN